MHTQLCDHTALHCHLDISGHVTAKLHKKKQLSPSWTHIILDVYCSILFAKPLVLSF